ncbi:VOC family protein [Enterococcus sp. HY326]|uniref:VOC family protein n=1 Tax=Enterococcus sp. HY326 TaxID=2971265 RepID=UPI00223EDCD4|nr:VOC family protein [Enterococcus sp. HY326]
MINHVEIYVSNLECSKKFYSFLLSELGYKLFQEWPDGFSYKMGGLYIVFVQAEKEFVKNGYHRKNIGLNHLAFSLASPQAVDELRQKLLLAGCNELYAEGYPFAGGKDYYAAFFEDPERLKIELVVNSDNQAET